MQKTIQTARETIFIKQEGNKYLDVSRKLSKLVRKLYLKPLFRKTEAMICGGAVLSTFTGQRISDIDIFFKDELVLNKFKEELSLFDGCELIMDDEYCSLLKFKTKKIQLIKRFYGTPQEILSKFDFTICQVCYVPKTDTFYLHRNFHAHVEEKQIVMNPNMPFPLATINRVAKYISKGYELSDIQAMILAILINKVKLENHSELVESIVGMESLNDPINIEQLNACIEKYYNPA